MEYDHHVWAAALAFGEKSIENFSLDGGDAITMCSRDLEKFTYL